MDLKAVIDEIWNTAKEEMDFLLEAKHMDRFAELNSGISYITYPKVYHDHDKACFGNGTYSWYPGR